MVLGFRGSHTIQNLNKKDRSTKASPNINALKSDESEWGRGVIRVMNEGIQKGLINKTTFLKVKRSMEKVSFVNDTVCFRYV